MASALRMVIAAAAAMAGAHTGAFAQATGSEATQAKAACATAAAAHYGVSVDDMDMTVRRQRTSARVIKFDLELDRRQGDVHTASCVVNRRTGEVKSFEVRS